MAIHCPPSLKTASRLATLPIAAASLLLSACAHQGKAPEAPASSSASAAAAAGSPTRLASSTARNVSGYKTEVANRLYEANGEQVFTGKPPPLLRSIVVLSVVVDENGKLVSSRVFRDNGDAEARAMALASLQKAAPLPRPTRAVLSGGKVEYLESWLFRRDGKFQVRTLAEIQASE
jgi:protein TonB